MSKDALRGYIRSSLHEGAEARARLEEAASEPIETATRRIYEAFQAGGKLLIFGNGGSAADAQHMAAEFVGRFLRERAGLPAIALTTDSSILTSVGNDFGFEQVFARQVMTLGHAGDVAIAISTSGNSPNVLEGLKAAREANISTIVFSGGAGGEAIKYADIALIAPANIVWQIQECHAAMIHVICGAVEEMLAGELHP
jgi:D-sedoheptulose 7-phosphate isomerase